MATSMPNSTKDKLLKLIADRDKLEAKIKEYGEVLKANGDVGMQGSLLDAEGFPRSDIDVYQVRQARQQVICLQNDHKGLMKQIELLMHKLHAEAAAEENQQDLASKAADMQINANSDEAMANNKVENATALVEVNLVSAGSPAEEAGLRVGDKILEFGTINSSNFSSNTQIAEIVRHMQNQRIALKVERGAQMLDLILIPRTWNGRGLLGCNIVTLN